MAEPKYFVARYLPEDKPFRVYGTRRFMMPSKNDNLWDMVWHGDSLQMARIKAHEWNKIRREGLQFVWCRPGENNRGNDGGVC